MSDEFAFLAPITELLSPDLFPSDLVPGEGETVNSLLSKVFFADYQMLSVQNGLGFDATIVITEEASVDLPGLQGIALVIGGATGAGATSFRVSVFVGEGVYYVDIADVEIALRFPPAILKPVPEIEGGPAPECAEIRLRGGFSIDHNLDFWFEGFERLSLSPVMISSSGVVFSADDVRLDLSRTETIPEVIDAGFDESFVGVFIGQARVQLPEGLDSLITEDIFLSDAAIGTGGVSGELELHYDAIYDVEGKTFSGPGAGELFGIPFGLKDVGDTPAIKLKFKQNTFVESKIAGAMILPFFDQPVLCEVHLTNDGDFTVALSAGQALSEDGLVVLTKEGLFELKLASIAFEKEADVLSIQLGGSITPDFPGDFTWPEFEIKALTIDSEGRVTLDGGWIDLPKQLTVDFYGFGLEVSKIGFGTEDSDTRWIGFSGGLKLCEGLPMSVAVEGLRIYWNTQNEYWLKFSGASLAFEIPDSVAFEGRVALIEDGARTGFKGSGTLEVIPTGLGINAEVIIGKNDKAPAYTFFYIYLDVQLPVGIPLFSTGAAIYGFAGLFAYNMEPNKLIDDTWYEDWYKNYPPGPGVSSTDKWIDKRDSLALGAGLRLGTLNDDGYAVNASTLLVLVLPGPILMIEGKAAFLRDRAKSDTGTFTTLAVLDNRAGQFLLNMDAHFLYPESPADMEGKLVDANAGAEAFFDFHNPDNWHLFLGQKEPPEKRVQVQMLRLFESNFYLMLSPTRFETGAWMGYDAKWKFGPMSVWLQAWIEGYALVSWKPLQLKAGMTLFGSAGLKAFGVGMEVSVGACVDVQAPTPYRIYAKLYVKMKLPWPLPDPEAKIELKWEGESDKPPIMMPLSAVGIEHLKVSEKWQLDRFLDESWEPTTPNPIVPLDAKPVLTFARPMVDAAKIGTYIPGIPAAERVGDYEFTYRLTQVTLKKSPKKADDWEVVARRSEDTPDVDKDKLWGAWQAVDGKVLTEGGASISPMTKLMLFAKSPFELARETIDDTYYDNFSENNPGYGTSVVTPRREVCFGFDGLVGQETGQIRRGDVLIIGKDLQVSTDSPKQIPYLVIKSRESTTLFVFPEPIRQVTLLVGYTEDATCSIYHGDCRVKVCGKDEVDVVNIDPIPPKEIPFPDNLSEDFNLLVVDGYLELYRLCYITAKEADRFTNESETAQHVKSASDADGDLMESELLQPNSDYELEVVTETCYRRVGQSDWVCREYTKTSLFQTEEPPGIAELSVVGEMSPSGEEHYPKRGPLRDLSVYVSKALPLEGAQAVYRSYDVGVEFNEAYVEMMYTTADKPLAIYLYDSNGQGIQAPDGRVSAMLNISQENAQQEPTRAAREWEATTRRAEERQAYAIATLEEKKLAEKAGHPAAYSVVPKIELDAAPKQTGLWGGGEGFLLKPNTLYRAAVAAMVPQVAIPLTDKGKALYNKEGELVYYPLRDNGPGLSSAMKISHALHGTSIMLISDGQNSILEGAPDQEVGQDSTLEGDSDEDAMQLVRRDWESYQVILEEALESSEHATEPWTVYSWSFYTSRFATFVHHVHSFVDAAWDVRATLGPAAWTPLQEGDENDKRRDTLKGLIETEPGGAQELYEKALEYFCLADRPLPERLEISLLEDDCGRYGFFVESPEPIPWKLNEPGRVSLTIGKAVGDIVSPVPAYGPVKLIGCEISGITGTDQVDLLIQTDADLAGYRIEQVNNEGDGALYYEFSAGSQFQAGAVLHIHAGEPPAVASAGIGQKDLYGAIAGTVIEGGPTLRLCDADGREIHRRQFGTVLSESYDMVTTDADATQTFVLGPDADGTRTFIFLREKQDDGQCWLDALPDGVYRFDWTFKRDTGDEKLPVLRRCGVTTAEEASIEFNVPAELPDCATS